MILLPVGPTTLPSDFIRYFSAMEDRVLILLLESSKMSTVSVSSRNAVYLDIWGNVRPSTVTVVREVAPTTTPATAEAKKTHTTEAKKTPTSSDKKEKTPVTRSFLDLFSRN